MIKRPELETWTTVFTNADLADTPEGSMEECQNLRPLNGKLVKTYGAGLIQDGGTDTVCPITVASGYSVINIWCYINENLDDGRVYVAVIQRDSDGQVWFVQFDSNYNSTTDEPQNLLPFGVDKFWVEGDNQTFNEWGRLMLTNVDVTNTVGGVSYDFPITASFHIPSTIEGTDRTDSVAYGNLPSDLGVYLYRDGDTDNSYFNDTIAFDNGEIKAFDSGSSEFGLVRIKEVAGKVFAITSSKGSTTVRDKLFWYDSGWTQIDYADFGITLATGDSLRLLHLAELNDELYMVMRHYDASDVGNEYHYRMSRLYDIATTPTWENRIIEVDQATAIEQGITSLIYDTVTSAQATVGGTDYLYVYINGYTTGTAAGGLLSQYDPVGGLVNLSKPTFAGDGNARTTSGIAIAGGIMFMTVNDATGGDLEMYTSDTTSWGWSQYSLPNSINGLGAVQWEKCDFIISSLTSTGVANNLAMVAELNDGGGSYLFLVEYRIATDDFYAEDEYQYTTATYSVHSLYQAQHENRTGYHYLTNLKYSTTPSSFITITNADLETSTLYTASPASATFIIPAIESYEITLSSGTSANDHISSIHFLFGDADQGGTTDPVMKRIVSFGANPDYTPYAGTINYHAEFGACMGWLELFQWLSTDMDQDFYHKADKNPIVMEAGTVRFLPGAIGVDIDTGANEAKGVWLGYIDRSFYDELYSPTAGFFAGSNIPVKPIAYANTSGNGTDIYLDGWGNEDTYRYLRYSFIYDGVQESLLSPPIYTQIDDDVDKAVFRLKMYDAVTDAVRSNPRITGVRLYSMTSASENSTATLIREIPLTLNKSDRVNYSDNGKARDYIWINEQYINSMTSGPFDAAEEVGCTVRIIEYQAGDDFTNVGASTNATGEEFVLSGTTPTVWTNGSQIAFVPQAGEFIGVFDLAASYVSIGLVTELGEDGWLLTTGSGVFYAANSFDYDANPGSSGNGGIWSLSQTDADGSGYEVNVAGEGYYGANIVIDTSVDFNGLGVIGLAIASCSTAGTEAHVGGSGAGDNDLLTVTDVHKYCILIDSDSNLRSQFKYHLDVSPYVYYTSGSYYSIYATLDFLNTEGSAYALDGVKYTKVNGDYAEIIAGRLWQGRVILDPGGENEEQYSSATYSELEQYDVTPVGNRIKMVDREGGGVTGISELFGRPVITMKQNISLIDSKTTPEDPTKWTISESPHNIGNIAYHGMVSALGTVYVCYYDGIYGLTSNNLAETDKTPTERLKITSFIEDKYLDLTQTEKENIVGEYDQSKNEILWKLGTEQWAYSTETGYWREINQTPDIDIITLDENADLMFYDEWDNSIRSFTNPLAVVGSMKSKVYNIAIVRDELLRYLWVFNPYDDLMTVVPYMDGVAIASAVTFVAANTPKQKIVIKSRGLNLQVQVSWASSTNNNELKRVGLEYDN